MKTRILWGTTLAATLFLAAGPASAGPPPMMDPSAMSGIPRPDPKLSPGTVTVRCLGKAGFSAPAVDLEVTLEVTAADGTTETFTAKTQEQGRATFDALAAFTGATAIAKATLGGVVVASGPIRILPEVGTAVMLVEGAAGPGVGPTAAPTDAGTAARAAGTPDIPAPGNAFPLDGMDVGTLTIGTFDLAARKPIDGVTVTLTITPPQGEPTVRTLTTDGRGKAVFDGLLPPDAPQGSSLSVEATLVEGGQVRKSAPFTMSADKGMALVLAEGADEFQVPPTQAPVKAKRQALPGPRILRTLPTGSVRIKLWDAADQPLANQKVLVVKKAATGQVEKFRAVTGPDGSAVVEDVPVTQDSLYFVESLYSRAPYQSRFFGMDDRGGIEVNMRLFETTADRSVVRSAVQYDVIEGENDLAQIVQIFEVMVDGDKAFWDPELEIESMDGSKGFTVLRAAEEFLDHEEKAPFATLHGPIPPGELTNLSIAYLIEHDGSVELTWNAPFDLIQTSILIGERLELESEEKEPGEHDSPIPEREVWTLPSRTRGEPVEFTVSGLRHQSPLIKNIAWGGLGAFALITVFGLMRKRPSRKQQLEARRDRLLRDLEAMKADRERSEPLLAELDRVIRQLEVLGAPAA